LWVNDQTFTLNQDFFASVAADNDGTLFGSEVVFAGDGISDSTRDDYKDLNVKGRIVLVLNGQPAGTAPAAGGRRNRGAGFYAKQEAAQKNGAAGILVLAPTPQRNLMTAKGNMYLSEYKKVNYPNTFYITEKVARAILGNDYTAAQSGNPQPKPYAVNVKMNFRKSILHLQSSDV